MKLQWLYLQYLLLQLGQLIWSDVQVDVSWDFDVDNSFDGWANSTAEEMHMEVKIENGELRGSVVGFQPFLESPQVYLEITTRHYVVVRMMYSGSATSARLLIYGQTKPGVNPIFDSLHSPFSVRSSTCVPSDIVLANTLHCNATITPIFGSPAQIESHSLSNVVDQNPYTYYLSSANGGVNMVFDVGDFRWITGIKILPLGDSSSPRRCLLQKSLTGGVGPFETVTSFTVQPSQNLSFDRSIGWQSFSGFSDFSRYWRVLFVDNYGGQGIGIREIALDGFVENVVVVPFAVVNTGEYRTYYLPLFQSILGPMMRMRFELVAPPLQGTQVVPKGKIFREGVAIDYVRIIRAPVVWRVRGCVDKYYDNPGFQNPTYNVTTRINSINGNLPVHSFIKNKMALQYATTYDCPVAGGVNLVVEGLNFGTAARVFIGGNECPVSSFGLADEGGRVESLVCTIPPGKPGPAIVRVQNGVNPGLFQETPSFSYRMAPPVPAAPVVTNIAACRVDLVWAPPGDEFDNMMVTGYKIMWFQPKFRAFVSNLTVGNVTTTSVRGLEPATEYVFAVAAMSEGAFNEASAALPTDLYGRRKPTDDALIGDFSAYTNVTGTARADFSFSFFNGNQSLNGTKFPTFNMPGSLGPTGQYGSESNYGLILVGNANIENCNVSSTCCDGYNATIGYASCGTVCAVLPARMLEYQYVVDGITRRQVPSNLPYPDGGLPEIVIFNNINELILNKGAALPAAACGPSLRLTPSEARSSGAVWYARKLDVREGFDMTINFQISNPSLTCNVMDDVNTYCRSRGADGFAFVIQNVSPTALGLAGSGLGYEGIFNSLAVEVDTFMNYDQMDFYENHISILTQGFRYNISANHSRSLATTTRIPDLTDKNHTIRIKYDPNFDENAVPHPSFQTNGYTSWFLENGDFVNGGEGDWGVGFGLMYIYLDDMYSPVITTPINLGATLNLDNGRAWLGLTAATGDSHWQAHDIHSWQFRSLYIDENYTPPMIVDGVGAHDCVNETLCVHRVDYDHYMRKNNVWGKGQDSTQPWMTGKNGFCAFC